MFYASFISCVALLACGLFAPPLGVIDNSVLIGASILATFPAMAFASRALQLGYDFRVKHKQTTVSIANSDNHETTLPTQSIDEYDENG